MVEKYQGLWGLASLQGCGTGMKGLLVRRIVDSVHVMSQLGTSYVTDSSDLCATFANHWGPVLFAPQKSIGPTLDSIYCVYI